MVTCPCCKHEFSIPRKNHTEETRKKMRTSSAWKYGNEITQKYKDGAAIMWLVDEYKADKLTIRTILKENGITEFRGRAGIPAWNKGKEVPALQGKNSPHWKGGVTPLNMKVRRCAKYREWVNQIFERDDWTCQMCGKRGGDLEADHHPVSFAEIMSVINSFREAKDSKRLWNTMNGRTLCVPCHNTTKKGSRN